VTPKPLLGRWKQELYTLFGIDTREAPLSPKPSTVTACSLSGELVGSEKGETV
jgi:hypothetical protein